MFINNIYRDDNFYIEKRGNEVLKFHSAEAEEYQSVYMDNKIYIFYEDILGNITKLTIENDKLFKEFILISKEKKNIGRRINIHFRNNELVLLFSSNYKDMILINIYTERNGICVFDTCDSKNFISLKKNNNDILVVYRKGVRLGRSTISGDSYSDYRLINSNTPISAYEFENGIYVLCRENRYVLIDIKNEKKYFLPLVFGIRPNITYEDKKIFLVYMRGRREITYIIEDSVILFYSEKMY